MKVRENKKILRNVLIKTLKQYTSVARYTISRNLDKLGVILQIAFPVLMIGLIRQYNINVFILLMTSCALYVISRYFMTVGHAMRSEDEEGMPIPDERYTRVDNRGFLWVEKQQEAMAYLCDVENYLQRIGVLSTDKENEHEIPL